MNDNLELDEILETVDLMESGAAKKQPVRTIDELLEQQILDAEKLLEE